MFSVLRPAGPVPSAHRKPARGARRRVVIEDLLAGLRTGGLRPA